MSGRLHGLIQHLTQTTGHRLKEHRLTSLGGGDINSAYRLQSQGIDWFIKVNRAELADMFAAEAAGLTELAGVGAMRIPNLVCHGQNQQQSYLVLEYIELRSLSGHAAALFGEQLARVHLQPQAYFGWTIDNTIGSTPQYNPRHEDWVAFWRDQRLGRQLEIAAENGHRGSLQIQGEKLQERLVELFSDYRPHPSLVHGDLWGGHAAADCMGNPVMFDPACYYGDHETDIAMTELFGGFGREFYSAYQTHYPLDPGYKVRKTLYNLYHILNHLNLFGSGYLGQANRMLEQLLADLK